MSSKGKSSKKKQKQTSPKKHDNVDPSVDAHIEENDSVHDELVETNEDIHTTQPSVHEAVDTVREGLEHKDVNPLDDTSTTQKTNDSDTVHVNNHADHQLEELPTPSVPVEHSNQHGSVGSQHDTTSSFDMSRDDDEKGDGDSRDIVNKTNAYEKHNPSQHQHTVVSTEATTAAAPPTEGHRPAALGGSGSGHHGVHEAIKRYKITIIGDQQSGKTSLLSKYLFNSHNPQYNPTIGIDFKSTTIYLSNTIVKFQLWDISGQSKFHVLLSSYIRDTTVCLVVFDVTNRTSYHNVFSYWLPQLRNQRNDDLIIIVVGTKVDLTLNRVVDFEEAKAKTQELNLAYIETSSLTGKNVSTLFQQLATILPEIDEKAAAATASSHGNNSASGDGLVNTAPKLVNGDDYLQYDQHGNAILNNPKDIDGEDDGEPSSGWFHQCGAVGGHFLKLFRCW